MAIDPQIPMSGREQPSFAQQAGDVYKLADAVEKHQEVQEQRQDQQHIQEAIKGGANLSTPEGIKSLIEQIRGKVSPKTFQTASQALEESQLNEKKQIEAVAKGDVAKIEMWGKKNDMLFQAGSSTLAQYDKDLKDNAPKGTQEAKRIATENFQKNWQGQLQGAASSGVFQPQELQAAGAWSRDILKANVENSEHGKKIYKEGLDLRYKEQQIKTSAAEEKKALSAAAGKKFAGLSDEQTAALGQAVERGLLDPRKLNSRTAGMWADQYIRNPDLDMNRLASDASMMQNATFMQKQLILETLPEIMKNMVDAGKKVDFSDLKLAGKIQLWKKGQLNDPDLQAYMTQRNDAMMTIASVMRGVGMSDKAIEQELQAAPETMSPKALEGWLRGQMAALKPRLRFAEKYTRSGQTGGETNTGKSTDVPRGAAPAGAIEKLKANPQLKDQFKAKYGYLPEGM